MESHITIKPMSGYARKIERNKSRAFDNKRRRVSNQTMRRFELQKAFDSHVDKMHDRALRENA